MSARRAGLAALAVAVLARTAAAEAPDLAGRWTLIAEEVAAGAPTAPVPAIAGGGWGREITIAREDGRVTIERHQFGPYDVQPPMLFVYRLDGTESRNVVNMGRGPQEQVARAALAGGALVLVSRHAVGTALAAEVTQKLSIDAAGSLVVETTRTAGGASSSTKARYSRKPAP